MNVDVIIKEEHLDKYAKKEGDIYGEQNEEELERRTSRRRYKHHRRSGTELKKQNWQDWNIYKI